MKILKKNPWIVIFDAKRHNKGKGIPIEDFIKMIEKSLDKKV